MVQKAKYWAKHTQYKMVAIMCSKAGIEKKTNHSLRATGATRMFEAGVPEKLIRQRTGHRSLDALRIYERSSIEQQRAVLQIVSATENFIFENARFNTSAIIRSSSSLTAFWLAFSQRDQWTWWFSIYIMPKLYSQCQHQPVYSLNYYFVHYIT